MGTSTADDIIYVEADELKTELGIPPKVKKEVLPEDTFAKDTLERESHKYGEGTQRFMVSLNPRVVAAADQYWRRKGFRSRSAFLRHLIMREMRRDGFI